MWKLRKIEKSREICLVPEKRISYRFKKQTLERKQEIRKSAQSSFLLDVTKGDSNE